MIISTLSDNIHWSPTFSNIQCCLDIATSGITILLNKERPMVTWNTSHSKWVLHHFKCFAYKLPYFQLILCVHHWYFRGMKTFFCLYIWYFHRFDKNAPNILTDFFILNLNKRLLWNLQSTGHSDNLKKKFQYTNCWVR